jgi:hypothetical protein
MNWGLRWSQGELTVLPTGGMLSNVKLRVDDKLIAPFYEAPWLGEGGHVEPPLLANLRSEFACVPFGEPYGSEHLSGDWRQAVEAPVREEDAALVASDLTLHGFGGSAEWKLVSHSDREIVIWLEYPSDSPIRRLTRTIRVDSVAGIEFALTIESRRWCRRPIGMHPNFVLPLSVGALKIRPRKFAFGITHPAGPEPGVSRAAPGQFFSRLSEVPLRVGGTGRFDQMPFPFDTEEVLELCGADGLVQLVNEESGVTYELSWDAETLPSVLLWMSNRGRSYAPWSGRNACLGVEPMTGAFDMGSRASLASNPINQKGTATAVALDPVRPLTIAYRFQAFKS